MGLIQLFGRRIRYAPLPETTPMRKIRVTGHGSPRTVLGTLPRVSEVEGWVDVFVLGAVSAVFDTNVTNFATSGCGALLGEAGMSWMTDQMGVSKPVSNIVGGSGGAAFGAGTSTLLTGPAERGRGWPRAG